VLHGFKQFVRARDGDGGWETVANEAKAVGWYVATQTYPDDELNALVRAAAARWDRPVPMVLEEFGAALVPTLLGLYGSFLEPSWRTLELLMNVETVIHRTVRLRDATASPPELHCRRISNSEIEIDYTSGRRLCGLAVGICRGVAAHFWQSISIVQPECMERGDKMCRLIVNLV
jgi:hypothetical protein